MNAKHQKESFDNEANQDMSVQEEQLVTETNEQAAGETQSEETKQADTAKEEIPQAGVQAELEQTKDQLLRLSADFDNFRKRTQREKEDWGRYAAQDLFEKILPVLDGLDQAAASVAQASQEARSLIEGFLMIQRQLIEVLQQEGLKEIPALGESFDPNFHDAVMQAPPEQGEQDNQIVMVLRKGYMYKERVLRASMVKVAKEV